MHALINMSLQMWNKLPNLPHGNNVLDATCRTLAEPCDTYPPTQSLVDEESLETIVGTKQHKANLDTSDGSSLQSRLHIFPSLFLASAAVHIGPRTVAILV